MYSNNHTGAYIHTRITRGNKGKVEAVTNKRLGATRHRLGKLTDTEGSNNKEN